VAEVLGLLGVSVVSALVPLVNLEAYLAALAAVTDREGVWLLAAAAGAGQTIGKVVWYHLGANALRWGWVRRKVETPKAQAKLELWRARTHDRPLAGGVLLAVSGFSGFPPFAIVAVLAGQLRMSLPLFVTVTFLSRTLRFAVVLYSGKEAARFLLG
jgi:membrane protein YqaA with SNARE-associated domain